MANLLLNAFLKYLADHPNDVEKLIALAFENLVQWLTSLAAKQRAANQGQG